MTATSQDSVTISPPPSRWTLPIVLTAQFVTPMAIAGTAIALPEISSDLGAQPTALQWVVNGFNVAFALGVLAWGSLSDRIGYRVTFTLGATLFAVGSAISAAAPSLAILDGARLVAGIGAAAILTGATAMLSKTFEGAVRTQAFALFGTINGLGLALGPTISGLLVAGVGWRGVFLVQAAVLALAAVGSRALPSTRPAPAPAGGKRAPILDLTLLRNREFLAMCLVPVAGSIGFVTLLTYLPSAFSGIKSMSPGAAGLTMLAMTIPVLVAPTAVAKLVNTVRSVHVGSVVYASLAALILGNIGMLLLSENRSIAWVIVPMVLLGFGFGLPIGLVDGHALAVVPAERAGTAAGLLNFFRIGSEAMFVAGYAFVLSTVVGQQLTGAAAEDTAAGQPGHPEVYRCAFDTTVVGLISLLIAITIAILIVRSKSAQSTKEA
ncbi:Predicted arabinose efflux permease, MFS family [Rhodococcus maanshanensis]|uniref:Predicted arabinose efflux permease, MFS family n=1 Tax=Rhodococcus maanshanensis TaxID=183556 RepID=A0A1H7YNS3_9NOCA|nr:Predicted arabinose efflux permease, MFS family [Rhodococcus maanshanensis]